MKNNILFSLIFLFGNIGLFAQNNSDAKNENDREAPESQKYSISSINDSSIIYPESMTENVANLLHEWQLDLSKSDLNCKRGSNVIFHDTVYAKRLYDLPTEMELSYNQVVKKHIEMYSGRRRDQVSYMLALGEYYFPMFEEALDREGMPLELKYLPVIESALNPTAVSRVGATGLWQFMLKTGKGYGLEVNSLVDERRDPYKSTQAAVKYLKDLYTIYGDWNLVIAAYNCGPGNVNKAIARSGGKRDYWEIYNRLPRETRGYVPAFIAANYIMNHYADHNICPAGSQGSVLALDTVHVNQEIHFEQIAGVLNMPVSEIKRLNPQYKKDMIPGNQIYALVLPTEKMYTYIDQNDSIINYNRDTYFTHRTYTDGYMDGTISLADGNTTDVYYRVKRGDNLSTIARRNGTTVARIKSWNGLTSDRLSVGKQLVVGKKAAPAAPAETQQQLAQAVTSGNATTINTYYRVRKGDTLGAIAQRNNVQVSQLRSWNKLNSTRIDVNDQLIVGQKVVEVPVEKEPVQEPKPDAPKIESNIISDYLKGQMDKTNQDQEIKVEEELEKISDLEVASEG
ncbi:MAG: transglycosylase SLT domain-containing protein [Fermentimonas sp.]|nr:transglycosylase SLT domain-containing protein [Fermentimonas sp.]MDD4696419.1 transglycosylase SLT domain-containing protein [Fermentimonas sp.]